MADLDTLQVLPQWTVAANGPLMSQSVAKISVALAHAQGEFEAIDKSAANPFFRSNYAPLPEVVKAATPILAKHGIAVWQGIDHDAAGDLLWTVVFHDGEFIGSAMRMRPVKNDPQSQGSAITYARRYAYMAVLGLVADEDDDGERAQGRGGSQQPTRRPQTTRKQSAKPTPQPEVTEPQNGSQAPDSPLAPDDLVKELRDLHKQSGISNGRMVEIIGEASNGGTRKLVDLNTDQALAVKLKLRRIMAATDGTVGEDD